MQKIITLSGLILSSAIAISLNAIDQKTSTIFACLADPTSRDCSGIFFDDTDTVIDSQNLTPEARKNLAAFFQKSTTTEIEVYRKHLETEHGLEGLVVFGAGKVMADTYDESLDELSALVLYRSTNRWISTHEEEAKIFFQREDVQEIQKKLTSNPLSGEMENQRRGELIMKVRVQEEKEFNRIKNEREKQVLRHLFVQGEIGFFAYQWEMWIRS